MFNLDVRQRCLNAILVWERLLKEETYQMPTIGMC